MFTRSRSPGDLKIDLCILITGHPDPFKNVLGPILTGIGLSQVERTSALIQPGKVRLEFERSAIVGSDDLVDSVTELETAIINRDDRIG